MQKKATEEKEIVYPEAHPRAEEMKVLKGAMNELLTKFAGHQEKSREHYKLAMSELKAMAEELSQGQQCLADIAGKMKELEAIVVSPKF